MKQVFIIIVSIFFTQLVFAQTAVSYTYDDAGNRITRQIVTLPSKESNNKKYNNESKSSEVEDVFGNGNITIYPNPAEELLNVYLENIEIEEEILLQLYDINGKLLKTNRTKDTKSTINLSNNTAGMYILKIISGNNRAEFTVVKK